MADEPMEKNDAPESFGVFKPVGHVVLAFKNVEDRDAARQALAAGGFADDTMVQYGADEMKRQLGDQIDDASVVADFGYEIVRSQHYYNLAKHGHVWLVVHAPKLEQAQEVARIAGEHQAVLGDRYGSLVLEKMLDPLPGS
jgi:hypothetical protein